MSFLTKLSAEAYDRSAFAAFQNRPEFLLGNAKALMWLSQLAYETDELDKVMTLAAAWGLKVSPMGAISAPTISSLPISKAVALVAKRDDAAFLAFAGTDPLVIADWIADFDLRPDAGTTQGFVSAASAALPAIVAALAGAHGPLFIAGHSLGGALAVVAARRLAAAGVEIAAVYTYGMPRPGDVDFVTDYNRALGQATFRLVHGDDIVPTVAPSFLGFRHVGRLLSCAEGDRFDAHRLDPQPGSDAPPFRGGMAGSIHDHFRLTFNSTPAAPPLVDHPMRPDWHGRPEAVRALLELLPDEIKTHLQESYLLALA
jgi:hypothetical protein